jgi:hypothetical protein
MLPYHQYPIPQCEALIRIVGNRGKEEAPALGKTGLTDRRRDYRGSKFPDSVRL